MDFLPQPVYLSPDTLLYLHPDFLFLHLAVFPADAGLYSWLSASPILHRPSYLLPASSGQMRSHMPRLYTSLQIHSLFLSASVMQSCHHILPSLLSGLILRLLHQRSVCTHSDHSTLSVQDCHLPWSFPSAVHLLSDRLSRQDLLLLLWLPLPSVRSEPQSRLSCIRCYPYSARSISRYK